MINYVATQEESKPGMYSFSYTELREEWLRICNLPDVEFMAQLPAILHTACFICWFKEVSRDASVGDKGIVHELVHLLQFKEENPKALWEVRNLFKQICCLS